MKKKLVVTLALSLVSMLVLVLAMAAYAQGPGGDGDKKGDIGSQGVGELGLNDPPPAGFSVLYMFTGVVNDTASPSREGTAVHCTNFSASSVDVRVEVWEMNPTTTYSGTLTLSAGRTRTFATRHITSFPEDLILSPTLPSIFQGSGRVLTKQHSDVICTAQVLDPTNDPPVFVAKLALFDSSGNPIGEMSKTYLPIILKSY